MAGLITLLRDLHRVHRQARDLREHLERLPQEVKYAKAAVARQEQAFLEGQNLLKHLKVTIHDKEVTLKTTMQQIDRYETQVNLVSGKKEYDALKVEIARAKELCGQLEDQILQAMSDVDERKLALPGLEQAFKAGQAELAQFEAQTKETQAQVADELTRVVAQIKEIEVGLPEDARVRYDRLVQAMGADALTPIHNRTCSSCGTAITAQNANDMLRDRFLICPSCGRIFYLPE